MPGLRKIEDERDARSCLSALRRSGKTLREWARANQVDGRSLSAWQINLSRDATGTVARRRARPEFVEIVATPMPPAERRYVVRVGSSAVEVEVGDDFDAVTLRRLVEVLRAC